MKLRTIKEDAYNRLSKDRPQVLQKNRGYGIVSVTVNDLTFAIPLRSNMNHNNGLKTIFQKRGGDKVWNGLDYSKALLVEESDLARVAFKPREQAEYDKIQKNKDKITSDFEKYVKNYIVCAEKGTSSTDKRYKFSTLQYFHKELGVDV